MTIVHGRGKIEKFDLSMEDPGYVFAARQSSLREGKAIKVTVAGNDVALWLLNGRVVAVGNVCAHQHVSMLHQGLLEGLTVACPLHGWTYSLETGRALVGDGCIPVYPVKIVNGEVWIFVGPGE